VGVGVAHLHPLITIYIRPCRKGYKHGCEAAALAPWRGGASEQLPWRCFLSRPPARDGGGMSRIESAINLLGSSLRWIADAEHGAPNDDGWPCDAWSRVRNCKVVRLCHSWWIGSLGSCVWVKIKRGYLRFLAEIKPCIFILFSIFSKNKCQKSQFSKLDLHCRSVGSSRR
jgi:hypothetical protein